MNSYIFHYDPPSVADSGNEIGIQTRLQSRLRNVAPAVRLVAIPNAGKRTAWAAMQAKREGLAKGFPDLMAISHTGKIAFLEIKARTGSLSNEQISWLNFLTNAGLTCGVFRSVNTVISFLEECGFMNEECRDAA